MTLSLKNFFKPSTATSNAIHGNIAFNKEAIKQQDKGTLLGVAKAFSSGWVFFSSLSVAATWYTFNKVGIQSDIGVDPSMIFAVTGGLAIMLEVYKHYSMKWIFTSQSPSTKMLSLVVTPVLFVFSFEMHILGGHMITAGNKTQDINTELIYLKKLKEADNSIKAYLAKVALESSKTLNNGNSYDDAFAQKSIATTQATMTKTLVSASPEMMQMIDRKLEAKADERASSGVSLLAILIMADAFILFSLLSKFIIARNADENILEYQSLHDELKGMIGAFWGSKSKNLVDDTFNTLKMYDEQANNNHNNSYNNSYSNNSYNNSYSSYTNSNSSIGSLPNNSSSIKMGVMPTMKQYSPKNAPALSREELDRIENRKLYLAEIITMIDTGKQSWLYFRGFISRIKEHDESKTTTAMFIESPLPSGFDKDDLEAQYRGVAFSLNYPIHSASQIGMWAEAIVAFKKDMPSLPEQECHDDEEEIIVEGYGREDKTNDVESVEVSKSRVKTIDATAYNTPLDDCVRYLWDNGNVKVGDPLFGKRGLKSMVKGLMKNDDIDDFYDSLIENSFVKKTNNGRSPIPIFKALVELHTSDFKEKIEEV